MTSSTTLTVELPRTGVDTAPILALAFALLLVGGSLLLVRRRQRDAL